MSFYKLLLSILFLSSLPTNAGFVKGTVIKTDHGFVPIESIEPGDFVYSYNQELDDFELCFVTHTDQKDVSQVIIIKIQDNLIIADFDQQFYSPSQKKWIKAVDLLPDTILQSCCQQNVYISSVQDVCIDTTIYELTIEHNHTFCVTSDGIVAHDFAIAIPIFVFGSGKIALASGGLKALALGVGAAITYIFISRATGASLDDNMDLSHASFQSSDPFKQSGGLYHMEHN